MSNSLFYPIEVSFQNHCKFVVRLADQPKHDDIQVASFRRRREVIKAVDFRPWGGKIILASVRFDGPDHFVSWEEVESNDSRLLGAEWMTGYQNHYVDFNLSIKFIHKQWVDSPPEQLQVVEKTLIDAIHRERRHKRLKELELSAIQMLVRRGNVPGWALVKGSRLYWYPSRERAKDVYWQKPPIGGFSKPFPFPLMAALLEEQVVIFD